MNDKPIRLIFGSRDEFVRTLKGVPDLQGNIHLYAADHPESNGRKPEAGDVAWNFRVPLAGQMGAALILHCGKKTRDMLFGMMIADCHDSGEPEPPPYEGPVNLKIAKVGDMVVVGFDRSVTHLDFPPQLARKFADQVRKASHR